LSAVDTQELKQNVELGITFDDGVELTAEGVSPDIVANFAVYQFDPQMTSKYAGHIISWFLARGVKVRIGVSNEVSIWNPWRLVCLYRAWKLRKKFL